MTAVASSRVTERFFLVGFMGTGKSTLGRLVAERMNLPFVDLDERVETAAGTSVSRIFALEGEEGFRRRESAALARLIESPGQFVVATGGGTFALEENRRLMKSAGVVVWLDVPLDEILGRIEGEDRPLWKTPEEIRALHERRLRAYEQAHHRLPLEGTERTEALEKLHRLLVDCRKVS